MGKKLITSLCSMAMVLALPVLALADSISPTSVDATLGLGDSITINKTVTVSTTAPTATKVDVFFLADTTGSMGGAIGGVIASATSILSSAGALGDVAFGVGEYKDSYDAYRYRLNTDITTTQATAQSGINMWSADGGADGPEAQLYALNAVATTTSWRAGSERIVIWFGDYSGHDPDGGVTEAMATTALQTAGIQVEAIDLGWLNVATGGATGEGGASTSGQATRITTATGGHLYTSSNSAAIVAVINSAIATAYSTYSSVGLDLSAVPAGVSAISSPAISGSFDRSIERTFDFTLTLTGAAAGDYDFPIYATVDGGRVATELDSISVGGTAGVPEPGTLMLLGVGLAGLGALRRRKKL